MDNLTDFAFKLGKVVYKVIRDVEASKDDSTKLIQDLGGLSGEKILLQKIAKFWNQQDRWDRPDGLVIVTSHRLVFLAKMKTVASTTDYLSFPLGLIDELEATTVSWVSPAIAFHVNSTKYMFTFFAGSDEVVDAIRSAKVTLESISINSHSDPSSTGRDIPVQLLPDMIRCSDWN